MICEADAPLKGREMRRFLTSCICCLVTKAVFCFVAITAPTGEEITVFC